MDDEWMTPGSSSNTTESPDESGSWVFGIGALDLRISVGCSALVCQTRISSVGSSRTSRLVETPFRLLFRCLETGFVLATRFDMERGGKVNARKITSTTRGLKSRLKRSFSEPIVAVRRELEYSNREYHLVY